MLTFKELLKYFDEKVEFKIFDYEKACFNNTYNYENNFHNEEWKKIDGFNYEVSNYGRIKNITTKKLKQLKFQAYGFQINLYKNSKCYTFTLSRLVAYYFIRSLKKNERVIHINHNIRDNYYKNLRIEEI